MCVCARVRVCVITSSCRDYLIIRYGISMQVNLKSTNLETHLFKKVLSGLISRGVPVKEVVTDANVQVISVMSELVFLYQFSVS